MKRIVRQLFWGALSLGALYSCANIGHPDGGPKDVTPPRFLSSNPKPEALNNTKKKIVLLFDEFIKIENASEKVVVSPPQLLQPEIKASGKKISIDLLDSLKSNTTYTIDFSDAILDNNEGNPLGNFSYSFSTGNKIDTLQVSGTVLEASNLEPVKGILVGLHSDLNDSAFVKLPFCRLSRTDSRGHFVIKGIAPGKYHIYALLDADQNFAFNQKNEEIAFDDSLIIPTHEPSIRMDTSWVDSVTYDTVYQRPVTRYMPDNILLRAFKEDVHSQYLVKSERLTPNKFTFYFSDRADTLPTLKGLNFDEKNAFIIESNSLNDTINYWIKDSLLYKKDTLSMSLSYLYTDTLNKLVPRTDTLNLRAKQKMINEDKVKDDSHKGKKKKKGDKELQTLFLPVNVHAPSSMDIYDYITLNFGEPVAMYDSTAIHLSEKVDSLWKPVPFQFERDSVNHRIFNLFYNWAPKGEYEFTVDSMAFHGYYGTFTDKIKQDFKVRGEDEYFSLHFNISGVDTTAFMELLSTQDKVVRRREVKKGVADFYFLNPGKYAARLIVDRNNNGVWDTGDYEKKLQPETVYYFPRILEYKALWDITQPWNVKERAADKQKPEELKKQKADDKKNKKKGSNSRTYGTNR